MWKEVHKFEPTPQQNAPQGNLSAMCCHFHFVILSFQKQPVMCDQCGKNFYLQSQLKRHEKDVHSFKKPKEQELHFHIRLCSKHTPQLTCYSVINVSRIYQLFPVVQKSKKFTKTCSIFPQYTQSLKVNQSLKIKKRTLCRKQT